MDSPADDEFHSPSEQPEEGDVPAEAEAEAPYSEEEASEAEAAAGEDVAENVEKEEVGDKEIEPVPDMIELAPVEGKVVVRQRTKLRTAELSEHFCEQLEASIEKAKENAEKLIFEDFDVSQNKIPGEYLERIFSALNDSMVHVERFRAFGCPTLDDVAATMMFGWLVGVTAENVPMELHLSDCAITADGFQALMKSFTENDAYPAPDPRAPSKGKLGVYMRLEHNYIDTAAMDAAVEEGTAVKMRKNKNPRHSDTIKVRLMVRDDGSWDQKKGEPPAPEDVPDARPFRDKGKGDKGKGKGKGKGNAAYSWSGSSSGKGGKAGKEGRARSTPPWQALPAPRTAFRPEPRRTLAARPGARPLAPPASRRPLRSPEPLRNGKGSAGGRGSRTSTTAETRGPPVVRSPYNAFSGGSRSGGSAFDRAPAVKRPSTAYGHEGEAKRQRSAVMTGSRVTDGKKGGNTGGKDGNNGGGKSGRGKLPFPWEEHWSDKYKMHYFWNSKTGDSTWERPK
eukprot:TRINITY_DN8886_c0_g1_i1.p1 TRINITY_DN8886_c0_g1~~TRINITY_DN8886_c0_g1_i1.p1  ORF type:complete len:509 (-),score=121.46 TRINITY_DN8886_c0_g1_i1:62-1588(-)